MGQKNINKKLGKSTLIPINNSIRIKINSQIHKSTCESINGLVWDMIRTLINIELNNNVSNISIRFV